MEENEATVDSRTPRGRRSLRLVVALGVVLAVALVAGGFAIAASFGSSSKADNVAADGSGSADREAKAAAFVACMRKNGVPNYPAAKPGGPLQITPEDGIDITSTAYQNAEKACQALKPNGRPLGPFGRPAGPSAGRGGPGPSATGQPSASGAPFDSKDYIACMRSHGVPDFPEPDPNGMFNVPDTESDVFKAAHSACRKFLPKGAPEPQN